MSELGGGATVRMNGQITQGKDHPDDYIENGRTYHGFRRGVYMCPCDDDELQRLDLTHYVIYTLARRDGLHRAPLPPSKHDSPPLRILDVGCGTGIWAIEMADKYPDAEIRGLDLTLKQPAKTKPNLRFRRFDFESPWVMGENSWDLVHLGLLCGCVRDWRELYSNAFRHLKPGVGHLEQVEIDFEPRCDDGTLPKDSSWKDWYHKYLTDATYRTHRPIAYNHNTPQMLEGLGFVDVQTFKIKVPVGEWSPSHIDVGRHYRLALSDAVEPLSLAVFTRATWGWSIGDVKNHLDEVRTMVNDAGIHAYNDLYIIIGRKPERNQFR